MADTAVSSRADALAERSPLPSPTLDAIRPMVEAGVSVHWLRRRSKAPVDYGWQLAESLSFDRLKATWSRDFNVGVRPGEYSHTAGGYLHLIDLDIRDAAQADAAWSWLLSRWPEARSAPFVISGSGGESRHIYFFTDRAFRSRKVARSPGFSLVFDPKKDREVKKHDWEIEVFGTRKQVVLPPSIHPETGLPYGWGREIEWDILSLGIGPIVDADTVESWGVTEDDLNIDDDDLFPLVKARPMGLSETEIGSTLSDLPEDWVEDRDCWLQVGQGLHHEYGGSGSGFERWCEWSKGSSKYEAKDQAAVWKSFKGAKNPVRMASLIKAAGVARLERAHAEFDDEDDFLTLPGTAVAIVPVSATLSPLDDFLSLSDAPTPPPIAPGARVAPAFDPEWRSNLQLSEEGQIKGTLHNVELIVGNDKRFRGIVGLNEFTQEIRQIGTPGIFRMKKESPKPVRQLDGVLWKIRDPVNGQLWSDSHDIAIRLILETPDRQGGYSLKTTDRDLMSAINRAAQGNRFHPVRDYLTRHKWDGVNRVERLFVDYIGAEDNAYHREAALLFMVGAVTRIFEPGHKFDFVPILEGIQGVRKSTFVSTLSQGWFAELEGDFHDKKGMVEQMAGAWVIELPELQGFSKAEVTTIKGFVSRTTDKVRLAYERRAAEFPRQCVFIGSTNETEYLRDATGGRRFWPIAGTVTSIDTDRLEREVDQLWAEAKAMYDAWRQEQPHGRLP
ncbi:VapE domain-containing protein, partial [Brevundimonas sp.]|uniref:VapE domain-containing protein n=1 Tax=Brevundimonas sp. TaxID=1871086 RepID=UPI0035696420